MMESHKRSIYDRLKKHDRPQPNRGVENDQFFMAEIIFDDSDSENDVTDEDATRRDSHEEKSSLFPIPPWKKGLSENNQHSPQKHRGKISKITGLSNLSSCFEEKEKSTTDLTSLTAPGPLICQASHSVTKPLFTTKQALESTSTRRQLMPQNSNKENMRPGITRHTSDSQIGGGRRQPLSLLSKHASSNSVLQADTSSTDSGSLATGSLNNNHSPSDSGCYDEQNLQSMCRTGTDISALQVSSTSTLRASSSTTEFTFSHTQNIKSTTRSVACQTEKSHDKTRSSLRELTTPAKPSAPSSTNNLNAETVLINSRSLVVLSELGKGGSSKVEQVFDFGAGQRYALKTVNLNNQAPTAIATFKKEIDMLKKLQFSDKIIKLIDYEYNTTENKLLILLECGDTDLAVFLKKRLADQSNPLHWTQRCGFWHDMLKAVQVLHAQGIVHSDIKPANFILVAGELKLIDFGIAKQLDADATSMVLENCVGTINYMAPECLQGMGPSSDVNKAGRKADVWSLGCILYYMTYGFTPFQHLSIYPKLAAITNPNHVIEFPATGEPHLDETLKMCLERDVKKRASIDQLLKLSYVS